MTGDAGTPDRRDASDARDSTGRAPQPPSGSPRDALRDDVSGLVSGTLLVDRLAQALRVASRLRTEVAVVVVDVEGLDAIGARFGQRDVDAIAQEIAARLSTTLRGEDTTARIGRDQFAVVLPGSGVEGAAHVAEKLFVALRAPFAVGRLHHEIDLSMGIAVYPRHGDDAAVLLRRAELAMYLAKRAPRGVAAYAEAAEPTDADDVGLAADLQRGLERHEIVAVYQPIVALAPRRVMRVEALARWRHPWRGTVRPAEFMPLAERSGVSSQVLEAMLATSLQQCAAWRNEGTALGVAVNLAQSDLLDAATPAVIRGALDVSGLRPDALSVDVNAGALAHARSDAANAIDALLALGIEVAIDGVVPDHKSLESLDDVAVHAVKIDRAAIAAIARDRNKESSVSLLVEIVHALGMIAIAKGVEDQATLDALTAMRCDAVQGFVFAQPMPAAAIVPWLARTNTSVSGS